MLKNRHLSGGPLRYHPTPIRFCFALFVTQGFTRLETKTTEGLVGTKTLFFITAFCVARYLAKIVIFACLVKHSKKMIISTWIPACARMKRCSNLSVFKAAIAHSRFEPCFCLQKQQGEPPMRFLLRVALQLATSD